jgi:hypothetical protein
MVFRNIRLRTNIGRELLTAALNIFHRKVGLGLREPGGSQGLLNDRT